MYALISFANYINRHEVVVFDTIEEALVKAEDERLRRVDYGVTWWIAEPMERSERFHGINGFYIADDFTSTKEE